MKTYSDSDLYAFLGGNDARMKENAFTELYTRYSSRVYVYCCRIMGDGVAAEDVFQETFLRFLQTGEKGQDILNVPAYLLRIARNLCFNAKRDDKSVNALSVEDFQFPTEDKTVESAELGRLIEMALSLLTEEHREAFVLQAYNGLSYEEIAQVTNVPVTTVRNRVVRAKKKMREILTPYMEEMKG